VEFSLKKHDGPARIGQLKHKDITIKTPSFASFGDDNLPTNILFGLNDSQKYNPNKINITILPNYMVYYNRRPNIDPEKIYVAPETGIRWGLSTEYIKELLQRQYKIIDDLKIENLAVKIPLSAGEQVIDFAKKFKRQGTKLFILTDVPTENHYKFIRTLRIIQELPPDIPRLLTGRIHPSYYPLLVYLGIDLFDMSEIIYSTAEHRELFDFGWKKNETPYEELLIKNYQFAMRILNLTNESINEGWIRRVVEAYSYFLPELHTITRIALRDYYSYLEAYTPTQKSFKLICNSDLSIYAPEVQTFIKRVKERYSSYRKKVDVIILLPCSSKKPYSLSKTHRVYQNAIKSVAKKSRSLIHEAIVTSPLGLVPRELEEIYPAAHYDIPVTGDWSYEEQILTAQAIKDYLNKFDENTKVIVHLSGGYLLSFEHIKNDIRQEIIYTSRNISPTSQNAIQNLQNALKTIISEPGEKIDYLQEQLRAIADYQFGKGIGHELINDETKILGKPRRPKKVMLNKNQIAYQNPETGFLSLGLKGAEILAEHEVYWVRFNGTELKGSSLFAKGIEDADKQIRPFDEVVILDINGNVIASGKSLMSGSEMIDSERGVAVQIRHKR